MFRPPCSPVKRGRHKCRPYECEQLTSFSSVYKALQNANGLVDLRELPNYTKGIPESYDPDGLWAAERITRSETTRAGHSERVRCLYACPASLPRSSEGRMTHSFTVV